MKTLWLKNIQFHLPSFLHCVSSHHLTPLVLGATQNVPRWKAPGDEPGLHHRRRTEHLHVLQLQAAHPGRAAVYPLMGFTGKPELTLRQLWGAGTLPVFHPELRLHGRVPGREGNVHSVTRHWVGSRRLSGGQMLALARWLAYKQICIALPNTHGCGGIKG